MHMNEQLRNIPTSIVKLEKPEEVTTTIENKQHQQESSFQVQESTFTKRLKNPVKEAQEERKQISKFNL
jgi:hypothetical protein